VDTVEYLIPDFAERWVLVGSKFFLWRGFAAWNGKYAWASNALGFVVSWL